MRPQKRKFRPMTEMTVDDATAYMKKLIATEMQGPNTLGPAMEKIEQKYGIPFWTQDYIRKGKAKKCDTSLIHRIRAAYLDRCETQLKHFQHEVILEKELNDDSNADLAAEIEILLAKIKARRAQNQDQ